MIVTHDGDPATPEGISHIDPITKAAHEALKGTPMADAKIYIGGTAATYKDIQDGAKYDLMIVALAALSLILLIMMIITRSLVAALVIVGTVALSLGYGRTAAGTISGRGKPEKPSGKPGRAVEAADRENDNAGEQRARQHGRADLHPLPI